MAVKHTLAGSTFFGFFVFYFYFCVCMFAYVSLASRVCRCLWRLEGKVGLPETEATGGCELPAVGLGREPRSSAGGAHAFNSEPSLQPLAQLLKSQALPHLGVRCEHHCCSTFRSDLRQFL